jgi:hypothetical protein
MRLPPPLSWLWEGWKMFSHAFGRVMSFIILTILWIVGFGTYGIVMKVMRLFRSEVATDSYWVDLEPMKEDSLVHQF